MESDAVLMSKLQEPLAAFLSVSEAAWQIYECQVGGGVSLEVREAAL